MNSSSLRRLLESIAHYADMLQAPLALGSRLYVGWVFLHSGWLKITDWEQTLSLFEFEYHVPLLSPLPAAIAGTAGELVFSTLVILGLGGRLSAIGLFAVNALAVISYPELLTDERIAGLRQHELWGFILAMLIIYGLGKWSLDRFFFKDSSKT